MRLDDEQESTNVEDRRGMRVPGRRAGGIGIVTVLLALAASYFFGIDPSTFLGVASRLQSPEAQPEAVPSRRPPPDDEMARFVSKVLGSTERTWEGVFHESGKQYVPPKLVLFTGTTPTACGTGQSAMGPFYCPLDQKVYIDLAFYQDLKSRFGAPGDFAQAYVIAHEVGHHVQYLLGVSERVRGAQERARSEAEANALSVRLELQADCLAGVWAARANDSRRILEGGDVEEALNAASAIGDDRLQQQSTGTTVPEGFTHGSSEQRVRWFRRGIDAGKLDRCDTFGTREL
ncbi:MAG: neutral zinc metallopeptidase [Deltaproteobacteria bacterium]|nr:neutral zinc metallopeptidase [Deltaproteobacteria bacterium]